MKFTVNAHRLSVLSIDPLKLTLNRAHWAGCTAVDPPDKIVFNQTVVPGMKNDGVC